ncbi:hypothetical protein AWH49_16170 [Domibacillus aminovorans]|uniref:Uncharacterized protein n=1 Tax=Domibacillus aminovorans TaxID=29332 RepID=A0A177L3Z1_9BACI|nr:hypothetical protein AWH49_16170 [Domibacillus aminovorans]
MLVVAAASADFSETSGEGLFFDAVNYTFPKANEKLKFGQRVLVEFSGFILESYPGAGRSQTCHRAPDVPAKRSGLNGRRSRPTGD